MATFEKRENGSWRVRIRRGGVSESATFPTKRQAQAWAVEKESEASRLRSGGLPKKTMGDMLTHYAETVSPGKRGARWEALRIRAWLGQGRDNGSKIPFVDKQLADVSPADISAWRDARLSKVSAGTVRREMGLMAATFTVARKEWGWIRESPIKDVSKPRSPEHRTRRVSEKEIDALCVALGFDGLQAETLTCQTAVAFLLAIETAMRQGEILGLTTASYSPEKKTVFLARTKNGSARTVPLSDRAIALISLLPAREDGKLFGVSSASCDALFRKAKTRAMIDDLHFHDSRREATSRLAKKVDVLTLAKITGHKNLRMVMVYYDEDMTDVANRLN